MKFWTILMYLWAFTLGWEVADGEWGWALVAAIGVIFSIAMREREDSNEA